MRTIIIPTLNEEENIGRLIESIFEVIGTDDVSIIVVDDNSKDHTQSIVTGLGQRFRGVRLIVRKHVRGLGSAARLGASQAEKGPVVVMDADLSHDPKHLPAFFSCLGRGYDVVVGSRYVRGGRTEGWPGRRIAISKVATLVARLLFRLPVKDPMSGFVGCGSGPILAEGFRFADYKFLLEIMVTNRALRVTEVPIVFRDRMRGKSKLKGRTILLYLELVARLLFQKGKRRSWSP